MAQRFPFRDLGQVPATRHTCGIRLLKAAGFIQSFRGRPMRAGALVGAEWV